MISFETRAGYGIYLSASGNIELTNNILTDNGAGEKYGLFLDGYVNFAVNSNSNDEFRKMSLSDKRRRVYFAKLI
jgi:hypothetical protein